MRVVAVQRPFFVLHVLLDFAKIVGIVGFDAFPADDLVPTAKADAGHADVAFRVPDPIAFVGNVDNAAADDLVESRAVPFDEDPRVLRHAEKALDGRFEPFGGYMRMLDVADDVNHEFRFAQIPPFFLL